MLELLHNVVLHQRAKLGGRHHVLLSMCRKNRNPSFRQLSDLPHVSHSSSNNNSSSGAWLSTRKICYLACTVHSMCIFWYGHLLLLLSPVSPPLLLQSTPVPAAVPSSHAAILRVMMMVMPWRLTAHGLAHAEEMVRIAFPLA